MSRMKLVRVECVKDFSVTIASNLNFSQHCKDATGIANRMQSFINKTFSFYLVYAVQFGSPHLAKNTATVQRRTAKRSPSL